MIDKGFLIQLTNNLYKLTLLFPKKEPLRYKMRELADDILADSVRIMAESNPPKAREIENQSVLENLDVLDSFFAIAKEQNWIASPQLLTVQEEYSKIKKHFSLRIIPSENQKQDLLEELKEEKVFALSPYLDVQKKEVFEAENFVPVEKENGNLNGRHQKILEVLKEKDRIQVWEIKEVLPQVTKRTLRRDFRELLNQGFIERIGERNNTFYRLKEVGQVL
ncbi:MAG: DeoR family transcriptional regulator [Patescibacteria group bacterium]